MEPSPSSPSVPDPDPQGSGGQEHASPEGVGGPRWKRWLASLLGVAVLALVSVGVASIVLDMQDGGGAGWVLVWFGIPFAVGAVGAIPELSADRASGLRAASRALMWVIASMVLAAILLREAAICLLIVAAPLVGATLLGVWVTHLLAYGFQRRKLEGAKPAAALMVLLVLSGTLAFDLTVQPPRDSFTVTRSVDIAASPDQVWPLLLDLRGITPDEGTWNLTQSVLQVPRPQSAIVAGNGVGAIRHGRWGPHVSFEEHLTGWREGQGLDWRFVFPNESVQIYTDRRIAPDGPLLFIETGSYRLEPRPAGGSRLTLTTRYTVVTHMNAWASLWGEVLIGDIQSNILAIIRDRAEQARPGAETVYQVGQRGRPPSSP
jgi:hypothetical protein